jgi:hypothetical protein
MQLPNADVKIQIESSRNRAQLSSTSHKQIYFPMLYLLSDVHLPEGLLDRAVPFSVPP